jgi:N-methylhydantoinase B
MGLLLANVRNPTERRADVRAQIAAYERAEGRLGDLLADHGRGRLLAAFDAVQAYSRDRVTAELRELPDGEYAARDVMEGDGVTDDDVPIEATVAVAGAELTVDFGGTADQVAGNVNAPLAVAKSAVHFVVRCVTDPEIPPNAGCYDPIDVRVPEGSLLNPEPPAAVVGGNVETSQRVTDVTFGALAEAAPDRVPARGQGTMNNLTIGAGGEGFTYYETIGGGDGGRPTGDGMDGVHVGMTNTLNTPVGALRSGVPAARREVRAPAGQRRRRPVPGWPLVRSVTVGTDATVSLLTERRRHAPPGAAGGRDGATGRNLINGEPTPPKTTREVEAGTTVRIETPGGGWGDPDERDEAARDADRADGKVDGDGG